MRTFAGVVLGATLVLGLTSTAAAEAPPRDALQQAMRELAGSGAAGVQLRIHDEQGDWAGSAGKRTLQGGQVPVTGRYRIGSITKVFMSVVTLQLVGEGEVALDDPIVKHLPRYPVDPRITVRMLLQHRSGLFNYTGEANPDGSFEPGIPLVGPAFADNQFHDYQPADLIKVSLAKPARFEPGTSFSYSNTGYVLIGELIEKLTGQSYASQVRQRILKPLRLSATTLPGSRPTIQGPHAHGYYAYQHDGELRVLDVAKVNPTWADAAGEIISTTRDLDTFATALFAGKLLDPPLLAEMRKMEPIQPNAGYGLGLLSLDLGPDCGGVYEGHDGGMHGYLSFLFRSTDGKRRLEMSVTTDAVDLDDPAAGQRFNTAMSNVIATAFCGGPLGVDLVLPTDA